jgi:polyisoprenoid-binding protein YceI
MSTTVTTATPTTTPARTTWTIDPAHSHVGFSVRHMMISTVKGRFGDVAGTITLADDISQSTVEAAIAVDSIDTREPQRDAHLRSADFFDAAQFPTITFKSRRVVPTGTGTFAVTGDLTIKGVTREVVLEVIEEGRGKDPWGGERAGFTAHTAINRRDFGLTYNQVLETGGVLVGEEIKISLDIELIKQA